MGKKRKNGERIGGLVLVGQAMHLLQKMPAGFWLAYFAGTAPFCIGLLYFWADMSRSAFANQRCFPAALVMAVLFLWMKFWHTVFCSLIREYVGVYERASWTWKRCLAAGAIQAAVQPLGVVVIPVAFLLAFPFYLVLTFYQNITILGDGLDTNMKSVLSRAWRQATLWPKQNHILVWLVSPWVLGITMLTAFSIMWATLRFFPGAEMTHGILWFALAIGIMFYVTIPLCPFGCAIAGNIAILLAVVPVLSRKFLGIETVFSTSGAYGILNTTFLLTVFILTYMCLDPIAKAAYVLRHFYSESLLSGRDLLVDLRVSKQSRSGLLLTLIVGAALQLALPAGADSGADVPPGPQCETTVVSESDSDALEIAIRNTLQQPEYAWRMPRSARQADEHEAGFLAQFFERLMEAITSWARGVGRHLERFFDWLEGLFRVDRSLSAPDIAWQDTVRVLLFCLLAAVAAMLGVLAYRIRKRGLFRRSRAVSQAVPEVPDIQDEGVTADQLPPNQWFAMAQDLLKAGKLRLAMRALFLGSLADLAQRDRLTIKAFKTNRDYIRELERRAHDLPQAILAFRDNTAMLEATWYGSHPATESTVSRFQSNLEVLLS